MTPSSSLNVGHKSWRKEIDRQMSERLHNARDVLELHYITHVALAKIVRKKIV